MTIVCTFSIIEEDNIYQRVAWAENPNDDEQFIKELFYDDKVIDVDAIHYVPKNVPMVINGRILR